MICALSALGGQVEKEVPGGLSVESLVHPHKREGSRAHNREKRGGRGQTRVKMTRSDARRNQGEREYSGPSLSTLKQNRNHLRYNNLKFSARLCVKRGFHVLRSQLTNIHKNSMHFSSQSSLHGHTVHKIMSSVDEPVGIPIPGLALIGCVIWEKLIYLHKP